MKLHRIVIAAASAAALIVAAGIVVSFLPTRSGQSVAQTLLGATAPGPESAPEASVSPAPRAAAGSQPSKGHAAKQDDSLIRGVGSGGSEQIPTATPTPYRLHPTAAPKSIAADDVTVAPHSKVSSHSVTTARGVTQVLIEATATSKPAVTLAYYQRVLTSLGMTGKRVPAVGGAIALAFSKGDSTVTLTVSAHDRGSDYVIHGVLHTSA